LAAEFTVVPVMISTVGLFLWNLTSVAEAMAADRVALSHATT
jgi:hypothetical protein